ncbi:MAG: restriction endonuclease subunit S [Candidatus Humimicrobiaceae bacterium]
MLVLKQTQVMIPKTWKLKKIVDLFKIITGTTPSTKQKEYWDKGYINWITPADMSKLNGKLFIENSERKITEKGLKETNLTLMPIDSIIVSTRAPVGYVVIVKVKTTFNQGCKGLIPKDIKEINPIFYAYYLLDKKSLLEHSSSGSTFKELSKKALEDLIVPKPPLSEQNKIAVILSTVDHSIEEVDGSITETEKLKKGLMQGLFTKGIGHNEFKETEIGVIPKEWEITDLRNIIKEKKEIISPNNIQPTKFIGLEHINSGDCKIRIWGNSTEVKSMKFKFKNGDILYGKLRPYLDKAVITEWDGVCSTDIIVFENKKSINNMFILYLIHHPNTIYYATTTSTGTNHPRTSWRMLSKLEVALPPLSEQKKIAEILSSVDERIQLLKEKKNKLERVKKGLMNELLAGIIRVKVET